MKWLPVFNPLKIMIKIDKENNYYAVMFIEGKRGVSILAKTKNYKVAKRKAIKFRNYLKEGRLLKAEKSIEKHF